MGSFVHWQVCYSIAVQIYIQARNELAAKGYTGVPVIMVGETEILGFDQPKLKEALGLE